MTPGPSASSGYSGEVENNLELQSIIQGNNQEEAGKEEEKDDGKEEAKDEEKANSEKED